MKIVNILIAALLASVLLTGCPTRNPPGPALGIKKVVRGGGHTYSDEETSAHGRTYVLPDRALEDVGIRCARSLR